MRCNFAAALSIRAFVAESAVQTVAASSLPASMRSSHFERDFARASAYPAEAVRIVARHLSESAYE
ncbi:MAG: hypothetical protein ACO3MW_12015, partial [Rhodospirillales bacterium]